MSTRNLIKLAMLGSALGLMVGCASQPETTDKAAPARDVAAKADAEANARAAAEKKAAEDAAAAAAKKAADEAEAKRRAAAAAPVAPAAPAAPAAPKVTTLKGVGLFDFDKAVLRPDTKTSLDKDIVGRKGEVATVKSVSIEGHADRLGSHDYNLKLSEKRAEVAKAYLVGKGIPANNIETNGFGKTQPATGSGIVKCEDSLGRKKLIECLQPHRRVVVELKGDAK